MPRIHEWKRPRMFNDMQRFLGLVQYLAHYMPDISAYTTPLSVTSMDADLNMYPILIPPVSNTFHFCHHPQPHHSQPYHTQSIIYHPSFVINGNSRYLAYSITFSIFSIFNRLPSPLHLPLNSVK